MNRSFKNGEPYRQAVNDIVELYDTNAENGLSQRVALSRLHRYGSNRLRKVKTRSAWAILVDQLESIVVILLLAAAVAAAVFGHTLEALAIAAAIWVNTVTGFVMELRATRAMESLRRMGDTQARVLRDGELQEVSAHTIVPGDILSLEAGDVVAADARLIEANRLQCDEAALTGESEAANKQVDALTEHDVPLADRNNMAYQGTAVTEGSGLGVVVATGMATELGKISKLVEEAEETVTPLEKRLDVLGRRLVWLTIVIAVVVAGAGMIAGKPWLIMLETAIALAVAAVPEGLPVVATLALARGMHRMARQNAVVKELSAVETLGAANLIFTDKTGTLTESHMTLARLLSARDAMEPQHQTLPPASESAFRCALEIGVLCNNANLGDNGGIGDPTEVALLEAAHEQGLERQVLLQDYPECREVSFDPDVKMMATYHQSGDHIRVAVKGAPEAVLQCCTQQWTADGVEPLDDHGREQWHRRGEEAAKQGLRLLALAQKQVNDQQAPPYQELALVGFAGLYDPPREGIKATIEACKQAGIRVVMGTGDHAATAHAIAREIGLADDDAKVIEARQMSNWDQQTADERKAYLDAAVFARVSPEQKLNLIQLYQEQGCVVAMTGDGVNDAPGLKKADIGIAMGKRGTEVAREAADMVLKDDAFETIVGAIEHGRTIFQNIRRFIIYLLSGNLGEIIAISAAGIVAAPLPMLPLQILYINFVNDVLPALALGLIGSERGVMRRTGQDPYRNREPKAGSK